MVSSLVCLSLHETGYARVVGCCVAYDMWLDLVHPLHNSYGHPQQLRIWRSTTKHFHGCVMSNDHPIVQTSFVLHSSHLEIYQCMGIVSAVHSMLQLG